MAGEVENINRSHGNGGKRLIVSPNKVGPPQSATATVPVLLLSVKDYQLLRVFIGQGPQQHGAGDGEDSGVAEDAQRQRDYRGDAEAGVLAQHPRPETQVLPK